MKGTSSSDQPFSAGNLQSCPCPRCHGGQSTIIFRSPDRQFPTPDVFCASRCDGCGLLYQNPRILPGQLAQHYPDDYSGYGIAEMSIDAAVLWHLKHRQAYHHLECAVQPTTKQMRYGETFSGFQLIPDYSSGGKVLEIGCAAGNRLAMLKWLGWESCLGSEYSASAATKARERGLDVITGPIEAVVETIPHQSLNAIVAGFVIEHVTDPYHLSNQLAGKLKSGGQFLFSTINIGSPDFWLYGPHWYDLDLPRHMVFFRKEDVRAMLSQDFEIEKILIESALNDYLGSARYRMRDGVRGWRKWLDSTLLRIGPRLNRPLSYLARAGLGARIYVIARKK